ncbi:MAG: bifunctional oligoribonuclease/PAP phosphatase NrnA [Ardenticatenales bacterium]|nr:bifunctional oligoribonuclease/PAP phosphatase NrnA [Ardenticatenales bacterium]
MSESDQFDEILRSLTAAHHILIFSHLGPDGDAVGSALGLWWLLREQGKEVEVSFADPLPFNFRFLPGVELVTDRPLAGHDLVVALDGSDAERYGANFLTARASGTPLVTIDHHKTNTCFGDLNWVDSQFAATAQMIYHLARQAGWPLSAEAAFCLATGCVTDTNAFSTDHTTPTLLENVADLMREGAPLSQIIRQTMSLRSQADAALWGRILSTQHVERGVAWAMSSIADRKAVGASEEDGSGISTFLCNILGVKIGILFTEVDPETVRLSIRSRPLYDVGTLALDLGGGGHTQASGATLTMALEEAIQLVIPRAQALVQEKVALIP